MKYGSLIIEKREYVTLRRILNFHKYYEDYAHKDALERLRELIDDAMIEDEADMPDDIVRLNSKVLLASGAGRNHKLQLVLPAEENIKENKISVIGTLGANIIGLAVDDTIHIGVPLYLRSLKIARVEKPQQRLLGWYSRIDF
jgi:regulator of nucleoside diphosphate kinase